MTNHSPNPTPTLHLMVGLPCSGKTMRARAIQHELRCLRLSPDDWLSKLLGSDIDVKTLDAARDPIEALLWDVAADVLAMGGQVILDFGFWTRSERDDFRSRAAKLGAQCVVHYCHVDETELLRRLRHRNAQRPVDCFEIDESRLLEWSKLFEPPSADEL